MSSESGAQSGEAEGHSATPATKAAASTTSTPQTPWFLYFMVLLLVLLAVLIGLYCAALSDEEFPSHRHRGPNVAANAPRSLSHAAALAKLVTGPLALPHEIPFELHRPPPIRHSKLLHRPDVSAPPPVNNTWPVPPAAEAPVPLQINEPSVMQRAATAAMAMSRVDPFGLAAALLPKSLAPASSVPASASPASPASSAAGSPMDPQSPSASAGTENSTFRASSATSATSATSSGDAAVTASLATPSSDTSETGGYRAAVEAPWRGPPYVSGVRTLPSSDAQGSAFGSGGAGVGWWRVEGANLAADSQVVFSLGGRPSATECRYRSSAELDCLPLDPRLGLPSGIGGQNMMPPNFAHGWASAGGRVSVMNSDSQTFEFGEPAPQYLSFAPPGLPRLLRVGDSLKVTVGLYSAGSPVFDPPNPTAVWLEVLQEENADGDPTGSLSSRDRYDPPVLLESWATPSKGLAAFGPIQFPDPGKFTIRATAVQSEPHTGKRTVSAAILEGLPISVRQ
jgi:hypothetical protein